MSETSLEFLLKRDRRITFAAIVGLTALAWLYLLWLARAPALSGAIVSMPSSMAGMPGMAMGAAQSVSHAWTDWDFAFMFAMWTVMMAGMMTPSAAPMILIYARVARQSQLDGKPLAATGWFAGGYLLAWTLFALVATAEQGVLERLAWLTPAMATASREAAGVILIAAGLYQWTPLKDSCLKHCRSPFSFIQSHGGFKAGAMSSLRLGLQHGLYCIGCCWTLMALLFAGGIMNMTWIAAIAIFVLIEKVIPGGRKVSRIGGAGLFVAGIVLLVRA